jgi:hypothetical protein
MHKSMFEERGRGGVREEGKGRRGRRKRKQ